MTIKTFKVELRADVNEEGSAAVAEIIKLHAVELRNTLLLIGNNRYKVQVVVQVEDSFYNVEQIPLDGGPDAGR